jgi:hypothetical protein
MHGPLHHAGSGLSCLSGTEKFSAPNYQAQQLLERMLHPEFDRA